MPATGGQIPVGGAVGLALSITALAMAAGQRGDPRSRMRRLERLKADGLVSGEEYEAKRAEILESL